MAKERARILWGSEVELQGLSDEYQTVFGVDGVHSAVRRGLEAKGLVKTALDQCEHGYMYIEIPRQLWNAELDPNLFHIFPSKDKVFTVVLPEPDGRFSASFYIPYSDTLFLELKSSGKLTSYLRTNFPTIASAVPDFDAQVQRKALRRITSVTCDTWHHKGKVCLLGDACHALFPFYGAGLNTGLEDLSSIMKLIDTRETWEEVYRDLEATRKPNTDAMQSLSKQRMESFAKGMATEDYQRYRKSLDILNNSYPESFCSVERLVRFTKLPQTAILAFSDTEQTIVEEALQLPSFKEALESGKEKVDCPKLEELIKMAMKSHPALT